MSLAAKIKIPDISLRHFIDVIKLLDMQKTKKETHCFIEKTFLIYGESRYGSYPIDLHTRTGTLIDSFTHH